MSAESLEGQKRSEDLGNESERSFEMIVSWMLYCWRFPRRPCLEYQRMWMQMKAHHVD